jgi:hypothetical protein
MAAGTEGGFHLARSRLEVSQVMRMDLTVVFGNNDLGTAMAARFEQRWKEEIERAVDKVKFGIYGQRTRDQTDKWLRHLWYKAGAIRSKQRVGPTVTRD